jgi:glycosyltransferase 2 family protein
MWRPRLQSALGALVSIVALGAVAWWITQQDEPRLPDTAEGFAWLALALLVSACTLTLRGWRWHRILKDTGVPHRLRDAFGLTLVAYMGNNVLPARGGELLKIGLLGARTTARRRTILGTVLVERILDSAILAALFASLTWAGVKGSASGWATATLAAGILGLGAIGLAVYLRLRRRGRFERFATTIRPVARAAKLLGRPEGARLGLLSVVIWCLEGVTFLVIARSIELDLEPLSAIAVVVLASLAAAIPALPGYVGTFDAALLVGLHAVGIEGGDAVGLLLLARFVFFVPVTVVGLGTLVIGYGGRLTRTPADDQELLAEQPPSERKPEVASRQSGAGG